MWLCIHKNIIVPDTKLSLGLRIGFTSSLLTADKIFAVNPRATTIPPTMSLLLEVKSMPALVIKPTLIFVVHMDVLRWCMMSKQHLCVQNFSSNVSRPNVTPWQVLYCTKICIPINIRKTFLLTHKFGIACAIKMTPDRDEWSELNKRTQCENQIVYKKVFSWKIH